MMASLYNGNHTIANNGKQNMMTMMMTTKMMREGERTDGQKKRQ